MDEYASIIKNERFGWVPRLITSYFPISTSKSKYPRLRDYRDFRPVREKRTRGVNRLNKPEAIVDRKLHRIIISGWFDIWFVMQLGFLADSLCEEPAKVYHGFHKGDILVRMNEMIGGTAKVLTTGEAIDLNVHCKLSSVHNTDLCLTAIVFSLRHHNPHEREVEHTQYAAASPDAFFPYRTLVPAATVSITGKRECGTYNEALETKTFRSANETLPLYERHHTDAQSYIFDIFPEVCGTAKSSVTQRLCTYGVCQQAEEPGVTGYR
ncbi:hypothetical protein CLF_112462 [Clonorchis sinensis]|uniref:Uncharacterized protein n=1 Tax=Clonorchis sinensis TaxID=79923 RepID=G7YMI9_CLOSI|nr:hypothetical protein CLF_112462 [Clonorchis sinensis]